MSKKLYLECCSGISGDMTVAALLDLGADQAVLEEVLKSLPVQGFETVVSRVKKSGIDACDFDVVLEQDNHDHDMEYLHGHAHNHEHVHEHEHVHDNEHVHNHEHIHDHEHAHDHEHIHDHNQTHQNHGNQDDLHRTQSHAHHPHEHHHTHEHRGMNEIRAIIQQGQMTEGARALALKIFGILAEAESKAHNVPADQVHFHEVGAVDSIVDIVSAAVCLDNLGIEEVIVPELYEGKGTIRCQHGILPVPVPAVANIVQANHISIHPVDVQGELVTPTGAAIVAAICTTKQLPEKFNIERIGIGAGKREYGLSGILRAMVIND